MKVYAFEEIDDSLKLLPLAARRALDVTGVKVSLGSWQRLPHGVRRELAELGSAPSVNVGAVKDLLERAGAEQERIQADPEPAPHEIPESVAAALGSAQVLSAGTWLGLGSIDRYALVKLARRGRAERFQRAYAEIVGEGGLSSHLGPGGEVRMVDISKKEPSLRRARAESSVTMSAQAFSALEEQRTKKGDVLATARLAGIMAAKRTSDIIPLCHPLSLTHCEVGLELVPAECRVAVTASTEVIGRTGVEMEAMVAATAAALTLYDMLKGIDRGMTVGPTRLLEKSGGKSGDYHR